MKTHDGPVCHTNRVLLMISTSAVMAVAAMSFAGAAKARDNVTFSVGIGVPSVIAVATNAYPVFAQPQPVYLQPRPVYVQPAPGYYQSVPVYDSGQPVYVAPQFVHYGRTHGWQGRQGRRHNEVRYVAGYALAYAAGNVPENIPGYGAGFGVGVAPVYYRR